MEDDIFDIYAGLDLSAHVESTWIKERQKTVIHTDVGAISVLARIERLVTVANKCNGPAFECKRDRQRNPVLIRHRLAKYYNDAQDGLAAYQDDYVFSIRVQEFYGACMDLGLSLGSFDLGEPLEMHPRLQRLNSELFDGLVDALRRRCQGSRFRTRLKRFERNVLRRKAKAMAWEAAMFEWRSRHAFLVLCFGYDELVRASVTPERMQADLSHFLNNRRSNRLLRGIGGYVAKIEEGDQGGLHAHIVIAYAPNIKNDIQVARRIGEYWKEVVTQGQGHYWNSNVARLMHHPHGYGEGLGKIDRTDTKARHVLRSKILTYVAKSDQHLKKKSGPKYKTFWMSQPPQKLMSGRPRRHVGLMAMDAGSGTSSIRDAS